MSDARAPFHPVRPELDFPRDEAAILALWKERRIFEKTLRAETRSTGPSKGTYVFYEGPPTANGLPHNGHVLTRAMKDLFPRFFTMKGYDVPRKAGWDTHGLPVEVEVEKELRIHGKAGIEAYGVEPFTMRCIDSVFRYTEAWAKLTDKIGFWVDLDDAYVTYHKAYVESVWWALSRLFEKGLLYQGHKVVWWWAQGGTALSSAEVGLGYKTVDDPSVFVAFPLEAEPDTALLVWTTTPWTLPSNMYAAVHADFSYAIVEGGPGGRKLIVAEDLVPAVAKKLKAELRIVGTKKGSELVGARYVPPFDLFAREAAAHPVVWSVIAAPFVTLDASGIVHVAPAFGEDDHLAHRELDKKHPGLPLFCAVRPDGTFVPELARYAGRWVKDCDKEIQHELKERGLLVFAELYRHDYPFCWRSDGDALIQFARPAWYIRTTAKIDEAMRNNQAVSWLPEHIKDGRFGDFLRNNVDWALSRERYWGTPLNVWINDVTGRMQAPSSVAAIVAKNPRAFEHFEAARAKDPSLSPHLAVHKPWIDQVTFTEPGEPGVYRRVPDVIDCWFDSGCMPFAQWGYPHAEGSAALFERAFPADFICEAIDQTRGWFYSLLMISTLVFDEETQARLAAPRPLPHPYKTCVVLGHVCDKEGKKESKSKGNYTPPDVILDKVAMEFAAKDAAALGLAGVSPGVCFVCREDYEGLDLDGDEAKVDVYRELGDGPAERRRLALRPTKGLPRRVLALAPEDLATLGLSPVAPDAKVMPSEVSTKLAREHRVTVEDPHTPAPGADAFRWFFYASSPPWTNTRHSLTNVRTTQKDFLVRLRNVYSFFVIYANIDAIDPRALPRRPLAERSLLDRWILSELAETVRDVGAHLEAYRSYEAAQKLVAFVDGLSNWYVRRSRGRFWSPSEAPSDAERADKENAHATLYDVLVTLSRLIAPFTPFFAEELHQNLVRGPFASTATQGAEGDAPESVHLAAWPEADLSALDAALSREMRAVREVVSLGLSVRTTSRLRVRQPLSRADVVVSSEAVRRALEPHRALVADELNVKAVRLLVPGEERGEVTYGLKPNFRALGPKLGKKVQALKATLAAIDAGAVRAELAETGVAKLSVDGETFELVSDELEVSVQAAEGFAAAGGKVGVVVLHTELDEALRDEGLARELLSRVQGIRKDLGLGFTDRVALGLSGGPRVARVLAAHEGLFRSEALAERVSGDASADARELEVDGEAVRISVSPI